MKKLFAGATVFMIALGIIMLMTATPTAAAKGTCANVRCASCPDGYHLLLKWPNCCACVAN